MSFFRVGCLAIFSVTAVTAEAQGRALTIEDYYRIKSVGAPQISPDGKWIGYTISTRVEATNGDSAEAWLASTDGVSSRRISRPGSSASALGWSESGLLTFAAAGRRWVVDPAHPDSLDESTSVVPQSGRGGGRGNALAGTRL